MSGLERLSLFINRLVEYLLFGLGFSMALIVAAQVFSRYLLNYSIFWSEELARFLLVWLSFLGASVAYRRGAHASIEVVYERLPAWGQNAAALATHLSALLFSGIMIFYGLKFAWFVRHQISPALYMPKWIPHGIIPLCGAILAVHALAFLADHVRGKKS